MLVKAALRGEYLWMHKYYSDFLFLPHFYPIQKETYLGEPAIRPEYGNDRGLSFILQVLYTRGSEF